MAGTRNYQSIGEVLVSVKTEFPDITISKIRFLEAEGLIEPERTPSGYRKFYVDDVDRLKSILRMQRDEYLPLKVIKERLLKQECRARSSRRGRRRDREPPATDRRGATAAEELAEAPTGLQMSIEEMSAATGVERDRIKELESFGIVCSHGPDGAKYYDGDDYIVLVDREGLLPVRRRAAAPHDVQALRGTRGGLLRDDRGAHAAPEEPRRATRRLAGARRPGRHVAQVQAGAAAHRTCGTTSRARDAQASAHRARRAHRRARRRSRKRRSIGLASAQHAPPPHARFRPTDRSRRSRSPSTRPRTRRRRPRCPRRSRSSPTSTRVRCCSRRPPTRDVRSRA